MGNNYYVLPYSKEFYPQIESLWGEQYEKDNIKKRKQLFEWITEKNPFKDNITPYYLLHGSEQVIGMHGNMPIYLCINGKKFRAIMAHDVLLSKRFRGKGLGKILLEGAVGRSGIITGTLWFNENSYRLQIKNGWLSVPNFYFYVKIIDPNYFIRNIIKSKKLGIMISKLYKTYGKVYDLFKSKPSKKNIKIIEIEYFDQKFDQFFQSIAPKYNIIALRNSRYLNWKFVYKPFNNYKKYAAFDAEGNLLGYMVAKTEKADTCVRGRILDFLIDPEGTEVFSALFNVCYEEMKRKVEYIQIATSSNIIIKKLKKLGFLRSRKPILFTIKNWEKYFEEKYIKNIENWFLTENDGDGDAWSDDSIVDASGI